MARGSILEQNSGNGGYLLPVERVTAAKTLDAVKDSGKHVEVALFGKEGTSRPLRNVADKVININKQLLKGCWK